MPECAIRRVDEVARLFSSEAGPAKRPYRDAVGKYEAPELLRPGPHEQLAKD